MATRSQDLERPAIDHTARLLQESLAEHPGIADCAVLLRDTPSTGPEWVAYVVPAGPFVPDEWQGHLQRALPEGPVPGVFVHLAAMPLTASGDVDEETLRTLEVIDPELAARWEQALRELPAIQEVAVVAEEAADPIPPLHLADLVPGWRSSVAAGSASGPVAAARPAAGEKTTRPPSLSVGPPLADTLLPTLPDALRRTVEQVPDQGILYIQSDGSELLQSYRDLQNEAERILAGLRKLGLQPGDKVLFQFEHNCDFIPAFWGCTLGGIVPVPISIAPTYQQVNSTTAKLHNAWTMLDQPIVLTNERLAPSLSSLSALHGMDTLRIATIEDLRSCRPDRDWHRAKPDDVALMLLTSGSTGKPKAVMQCHRSLLYRSAATAQMNDFCRQDVSLNWFPLDHVGGVVMFHVRDLCIGCRQLHVPTQVVLRDPLLWLDLIDRHRATVTWAPNFAYGLVNARAEDVAQRRWDLSSMRFILNAGEAIVARTARRFLEVLAPHGLPATAMRPAWGMSETSSAVTYSDRFTRQPGSDSEPFVEVGSPIPGFSMRIVDAGDQVVPEGEIGSLQVKGPTVTSGYYQNPTLNQEVFRDGWFVTGDLGVVRDGHLTITGRQKDVIISNGVNFYCHEIEAVVEEVPGIDVSFTAACAIREPGKNTDSLAIFFHPKEGDAADLPSLLKEVRGKVARSLGLSPTYLLPVARQEIPKGEIGKIMRSQLRQRLEAGDFDGLIKHVDIVTGGPNTVPAWFFRKTWRRRALDPIVPEPAACLLFTDRRGLGQVLWARLEELGHKCVVVEEGDSFTCVGPGHYRIHPARPEDYEQLFDAADVAKARYIFHLWTYDSGPEAIDSPAAIDRARETGTLSLLALARGLAPSGEPGRRARLLVASRMAQATAREDVPAWPSAGLPALIQTLAQEVPGVDCRHVDLDEDDLAAHAAALVRELGHTGEREVAYRRRRRLIPRLERMALDRQPRQSLPFAAGELYLLSGGLGGIGAEIARYLLTEHGARLLLVGRTPLPPRQEWDQHLDEATPTGQRLRAYRALEQLGEVAYAAVDVCDAAGLREAVQEAEARWGRGLAGVLHLAGSYRDRTLAEETPESFTEALRAKVDGARVLHQLLADHPNALFIHFSSVLSYFGGAMVGAYAAANRMLESFAHYQRHQCGMRSFCLAWSGWQEVGMNRGNPNTAPLRAKGIQEMSVDQALHSLLAGLYHDQPHLLVGLDGSNPHVRRHLDEAPPRAQRLKAYCTTSNGAAVPPDGLAIHDRFGVHTTCRLIRIAEMPRTADGAVDRDQLLAVARRTRGGPEYVAPRTPTEERIVAIWQEVLGARQVGVHDSFFELGGHSLLATKVISRIRDAFGVELSPPTLFAAPTVAELAKCLEAVGESAAPEAPPLVSVSRRDSLPLSFAQQRLWFFHALDPDSPVYNIPSVVRLGGPLDVIALEKGLHALLQRHEALRTKLPVMAGQPVQVVAEVPSIPLPVQDLGGLTPARREAEALRLAREEVRRPFDLAADPLLRGRLLRLDTEDHLLVLTMHHIASDGWSLGVLYRELAALYGAFVTGVSLDLQPLPIQYADYAVWQRQWLQGEVLDRQLAYWRKQLAAAPVCLDLPADHPRLALQTFRGAIHRLSLPARLAEGALALSRQEGTTLFMTLLAAFQGLLYACTGQEDICVGSPIAGRTRTETEGLIGFFANTLVLRTRLDGSPPFRELLRRARETALGGQAHQDVPFEKLVEALRPPRDPSRNPLFQVNFRVQMAPPPHLQLPQLTCSPVDVDPGIARFDMALELWLSSDGLGGYVEYNTDLFEKATIVQMVADFEMLLEAFVTRPETPLNELAVVAEVRQRVQARPTIRTADSASRGRGFRSAQRKAVDLSGTGHLGRMKDEG